MNTPVFYVVRQHGTRIGKVAKARDANHVRWSGPDQLSLGRHIFSWSIGLFMWSIIAMNLASGRLNEKES